MSHTTTHAMSMRKAVPADEARIVEICRAIDPNDYVPQMLDWSSVDDGPGGIYVVELDGRVVGLHAVDVTKPDNAFFFAMRIDPQVQGQGIGSAYARLQIEGAAAAGMRHLFLSSAPWNVRAHRAVEKHGFVNVGPWFIYEEQPVPPIPAEPGRARAGRAEDLPLVAALRAGLAGLPLTDVIPAADYPYGYSLMRDEDWGVEQLVVVEVDGGLEGVMLLSKAWMGDQLYIRSLEGTPAAAAELLGYAKVWGEAQGLTKWCISLPTRCEELIAPLGLNPEACERWFIFRYDVN